jgi:hypothetical protein
MDLIIREYEVESRKEGATLLAKFLAAGYDIKIVVSNMHKSARIPELSYYQVWSDGTVTRDDAALDFPDVKACNYALIKYDGNSDVEPLNKI